MKITKDHFGVMPDKREVSTYTIEGGRMRAVVTDLGASLLSLYTPDRKGRMADVVLGHARMEDYLTNKGCFGASVGPHANRIAQASFVLEGKEYRLTANNGANNLHSGGYFYRSLLDAETAENAVTFRMHVADMEDGFPGNRDFAITYTLTDTDLRIDYRCVSDKTTIFNLTNHSYFNLKGEGNGDILDHYMKLCCSAFTPTDSGSIPTGEIRPVDGTAFDFTKGALIGEKMDLSDPQIQMVKGYDHNFVIDGYRDGTELLRAGVVEEKTGGRVMEVLTTAPGMQIYTFNRDPYAGGKGGKTYPCYAGIAMETQFFPDSVHHDNFPSPVFAAGKPFVSTTIYRFGECS